MGGCATKPKDLDGPKTLPAGNPGNIETTPESINDELPAIEVKTVTESQEEPLVDISTPKAEEQPAVEAPKLAEELGELKAEAPKANTEEESSNQNDDKTADKIAEKVEELAEFVNEDKGLKEEATTEDSTLKASV